MTGSALLLFLLAAWPVYHWQNRAGSIGGPISRVKVLWLVYAIVLWFVTPLFFWNRAWIYPVLTLSMLLRGLVEIPLCWFGAWRVWMGLTHDCFHGILLVIGIQTLFLDTLSLLWLALMLVGIVCEIVFVGWFRQVTGGPKTGTYFVPETDEYATVNRRTLWLAVPQWLAFAVLCVQDIIWI